MHYLINARLAHYSLSLPNLIGGRLLPGLKSLKELSLSAVHVDDGEVQLLLSNFPLLESLSIAFSERLINVSIAGHSLIKLKHLDISYANNLKSIEIDNMINLVSLRCYRLYAYVLKLNNVPKLTELASSDKRNNTFVKVLPTIPSRIHDQLLLLKLYTVVSLPKFVLPEFINVKHVELVHLMCQWCYTSNLFPLIEACSSLEKLVIKFLWPLSHTTLIDRKIYFPKMKLSPNFKKLKLSGYLGSTSELGIALFIIKNVVALEELTIEPCDVTQEIRRVATARAWQHFRPITPDSVNLVII